MSENLVLIDELTLEQIAGICDHTFLNRPEAYQKTAKSGESPVALREAAFRSFLETTAAMEHQPYGLCVRHEDLVAAQAYFSAGEKRMNFVSVAGFPNGCCPTGVKVAEAIYAASESVDEVDMVLNAELLRAGNELEVETDINAVLEELREEHGIIGKLILETSELTPDQIRQACEIADRCGVDFVKTSTGFGKYGARVEDVRIMKEYFPRGIKISGGVTKDNMHDLLRAASGRSDGYINLDPALIRIGESSLLAGLVSGY